MAWTSFDGHALVSSERPGWPVDDAGSSDRRQAVAAPHLAALRPGPAPWPDLASGGAGPVETTWPGPASSEAPWPELGGGSRDQPAPMAVVERLELLARLDAEQRER